jgi:hypothetical protein
MPSAIPLAFGPRQWGQLADSVKGLSLATDGLSSLCANAENTCKIATIAQKRSAEVIVVAPKCFVARNNKEEHSTFLIG